MSTRDARILDDAKINVKMKLSAFWATLLFLYVYADVLSLYKPGQLDEIVNGRMGPFQVSQVALLAASLLVIIPALMIVLSLALQPTVNRWTNVVLGVVFTLVNVNNLIGETWIYYLLFGTLEIALTLLIVASAWKWPQATREVQANESTPTARRDTTSAEDRPPFGGRRV